MKIIVKIISISLFKEFLCSYYGLFAKMVILLDMDFYYNNRIFNKKNIRYFLSKTKNQNRDRAAHRVKNKINNNLPSTFQGSN